MRAQARLRKQRDFEAVFKKGRTVSSRFLVLRSLPNGLACNRVGFITSKRVGKAVVRNRVRRRLREAVRTVPARLGNDLVISARVPAATATFDELAMAVAKLFARADILIESSAGEETSS